MSKIGLFDSGVGGLTVLQQIIHLLPDESFIYFGDTARVPYGEKSRETVIRYSRENAEFLHRQGLKLLVVACNTASAYAIDDLQDQLSIPVVGVITPGVETALQATRNGSIAVLGTKGTINSGVYQEAIFQRMPTAQVHSIACPLFVPLVEENYIDHPATKMIVEEYLAPLKKYQIDTILLGCTHYPLLREVIQEVVDDDVVIVDSAYSCALKVSQMLDSHKGAQQSAISQQFYVSDDPERFRCLGTHFLASPIQTVSLVEYPTPHNH